MFNSYHKFYFRFPISTSKLHIPTFITFPQNSPFIFFWFANFFISPALYLCVLSQRIRSRRSHSFISRAFLAFCLTLNFIGLFEPFLSRLSIPLFFINLFCYPLPFLHFTISSNFSSSMILDFIKEFDPPLRSTLHYLPLFCIFNYRWPVLCRCFRYKSHRRSVEESYC